MTDEELIAALCVRIGMIMEDICGDAVTVRPEDEERLGAVGAKLQRASDKISALTGCISILSSGD